jgi:hypothetical protein
MVKVRVELTIDIPPEWYNGKMSLAEVKARVVQEYDSQSTWILRGVHEGILEDYPEDEYRRHF